uniref:Proline and serine rich 2 n=1 Tax=Amphilophus citrinellus TaxID=61819 RepID=A0A3Q0SST7_AMPCI
MDSLPSEYNPPLPSGAPRPTDSSYHPPGCIPTPVLIAQKMAENQPARTSNLFRHSSLESEKPPSLSTDHPVKQGPPTSAKPTRFPANINVIRGSKEHQNQSLPNVKIQERQAQMLANLAAPKNDLPDILSSHIDRRQTLPAKSEPPPPQPEPNNYGGKSRTINPITGLYRTADSPARSSKPPAPTTAPRPPRHSYHGITTPQKPASSLPTEHKRRSNSLFRPQGITVQFSGRGEMNESRREALRKLGLLKES